MMFFIRPGLTEGRASFIVTELECENEVQKCLGGSGSGADGRGCGCLTREADGYSIRIRTDEGDIAINVSYQFFLR